MAAYREVCCAGSKLKLALDGCLYIALWGEEIYDQLLPDFSQPLSPGGSAEMPPASLCIGSLNVEGYIEADFKTKKHCCMCVDPSQTSS